MRTSNSSLSLSNTDTPSSQSHSLSLLFRYVPAQDRYHVMSKLGWGHFSTVWLAWDSLKTQPVVVKVQKSAQRYQEAARDEVELLKQVSGSRDASRQCLVLLNDHFIHKGLNGTHHVMAFEVLGPTLLSLIKQTSYRGLPVPVVRRLATCILIALRHLHEALSIIHTDLKPENVLCCYTEREMAELVERAQQEAVEAAVQQEEAAKAELKAVQAAANGGGGGGENGGGNGGGAAAGKDGGGLSKSQKRRLKEKEKKKAAAGAAAAAGGGEEDEDGDGGEGDRPAVAGGDGGKEGANGKEGKEGKEPRLRQHRPPPTALDAPSMYFKVVDLGNACWRDKHFTADIQTRQYRCPEVILGAGYDTSADMWSVACVLFEAATGDMLFSPKAGQTWSRDEDHMALLMELVRSRERCMQRAAATAASAA